MGLSYKDTVLQDNPRFYWRFEDFAGTSAADSSTAGTFTGSILNSASIGFKNPTILKGDRRSGTSSSFFANSSSPQVYINSQDLGVTTGSFSFEWWVKPYTWTSFNNRMGTNWGTFLFHADGGGGAYVGMQIGDRFTPSDVGVQFTSGTVTHVVFTYDGTNGCIYTNGVLRATKAMSPPSNFVGSAQFGVNAPGLPDIWSGHYDEIAFYTTALSLNRVQNHYVTGSTAILITYADAVNNDLPLLWYRLGDGSGSVSDSGSANLPGTFVGGATGVQFEVPGLINDADVSAGVAGAAFGISASLSSPTQYINTAGTLSIGGSQAAAAFTVEWWMKPSSFTGSGNFINTVGKGFGFFYAGCSGSSGSGFCGINSADMFTPHDLGPGFFNLNATGYYAFSFDGTVGKVYKNGRFIAAKPMAYSSTWGSNAFAIASGALWSAEYDEVAVYGTVLPDASILSHYTFGLSATLLPAPTVTSLSSSDSNRIFSSGGNYVLISGSNFQPNAKAYVSGVLASFQTASLDGNTIRCFVPSNPVGPADVSVLNPDGQSATASLAANYINTENDYWGRVIADMPVLYWRLTEDSGSITAPPYVTPDANTVLQWKLDTTGGPPFSSSVGSLLPMLPVGYSANQWNQQLGVSSSLFAPYSGSAAFPGPSSSPYFLQTGPTGSSIGEVTTNLTIQCWVFLNDYGYGNWQQIFGKNYRPDGTWTAPFVSIGMALIGAGSGFGAGQMKANLAIGGSLITYNFNLQMPLKRWVHLAMTYDGSNVRLYMNGIIQNTIGQSGVVDYGTHGTWTIGGDNSNPPSGSFETINGYVADARMENTVRSAGYLAGFTLTGSAPTVLDWSNHGNTGTVNLPNPYLIFRTPSLIRASDDFSMTNVQSSAPTPFISNTGDPNGVAAPPSCGIGSGSFANQNTSFSAEWWYRVYNGLSFAGIGTHRFGFANNQFLYNVTTNGGNVTAGTDAGSQFSVNNFVDPNPSNPPKAHHYCFTFKDADTRHGTGSLYRDGVLIAGPSTMNTPQGWQAFEAIGPFSGSFDEVAVYPYALTAQQVATHYSTGLRPYTYSDNIFAQTSNSAGLPVPGGMSDQLASGSGNPFQNTGSVAAFPSPGYMFDNMWPSFSPLAEGAPGFFQSQALFDFTTWTQAIQGAGFLDTQHNVQFLWPFNAGSGSGGGGGGGSTPPAPTIQNFAPGIGLPISSGTQISFDIVSSTGFVPYFAIIAQFGGVAAQDLVYNSVAFNSMYSNSHNTVSAISGGFHITMLRDGGWLDDSVTIIPVAFSTGSENT